MNRNRPTRILVGSLALVLFVVPASQVCANVLSTKRFVELQSRWSALAKAKTRIIVEGRYASRAGNSFRLQNCDVMFQPKPGKSLPPMSDRKKNLELSGYLKRSSGRFHFIVERHKIGKSDIERLVDSKLKIQDSKADRWYKLGRETAERAEFFEDDDLQKAARFILTEGVHREERSLKADDIQGLRALAERVKELKLDDRHRFQLLHEALWIQWRAEKNRDGSLKTMLQQLAADLPGVRRQLEQFDNAAWEAYQKRARSIYREADDKTREKLHRYFWLTVQLAEVNRTAANDSRDGYETASIAEKLLPELSDLPDKYRREQLKRESERLNRLSQSEMRTLCQRYRVLGEGREANEVVSKWLTMKEKQLRTNGPSGLIRIADLYRDELKDEAKESALLKEAWKLLEGPELNKDRQELRSRLSTLGWTRDERSWIKGQDKQPAKPVRHQPGGVEVGMSTAQVQRVLNGQPTSKVRFASKDKVTELWLYRDSGLVVQFDKVIGTGLTAVNVKALR